MKQLPKYYNMQIGQIIEIMKKWRKQNWAKFCHFLREKYESANQAQIYYSKNFLEIFKKKQHTNDKNL